MLLPTTTNNTAISIKSHSNTTQTDTNTIHSIQSTYNNTTIITYPKPVPLSILLPPNLHIQYLLNNIQSQDTHTNESHSLLSITSYSHIPTTTITLNKVIKFLI